MVENFRIVSGLVFPVTLRAQFDGFLRIFDGLYPDFGMFGCLGKFPE